MAGGGQTKKLEVHAFTEIKLTSSCEGFSQPARDGKFVSEIGRGKFLGAQIRRGVDQTSSRAGPSERAGDSLDLSRRIWKMGMRVESIFHRQTATQASTTTEA